MHTSRAIWAGITGAIVMSIIMALGRMLGMNVNLEMLLGTMFNIEPGLIAWLTGFAIHLMFGAIFGLLYAAGFEYVAHRSGAGLGMAFSLPHLLIAGAFLGMIPALHPMVPEVLPSPGVYMTDVELGPVAFILLHLAFGAIVGGMYKHVVHARPLRTREAM